MRRRLCAVEPLYKLYIVIKIGLMRAIHRVKRWHFASWHSILYQKRKKLEFHCNLIKPSKILSVRNHMPFMRREYFNFLFSSSMFNRIMTEIKWQMMWTRQSQYFFSFGFWHADAYFYNHFFIFQFGFHFCFVYFIEYFRQSNFPPHHHRTKIDIVDYWAITLAIAQ